MCFITKCIELTLVVVKTQNDSARTVRYFSYSNNIQPNNPVSVTSASNVRIDCDSCPASIQYFCPHFLSYIIFN